MSDRTQRHVQRFNHAVTTGDWEGFAEGFALDARMEFAGVDVPVVEGREAVLDAYLADPPTDTIHAVRTEAADGYERVSFTWSRGGTGTMDLTWDGDLVSGLRVSF